MSRSNYAIFSCLVSLVLLVGKPNDSFGVSTLSQQAVAKFEAPIEATENGLPVKGSAGKDSMTDTTSKPVEMLNEVPPSEQPGRRISLSNRLLLTGTLVIVLLGQLSVLFGYLKINHATRGFYSGRLQSFSAVASVTVLAACYLFYVTWKV